MTKKQIKSKLYTEFKYKYNKKRKCREIVYPEKGCLFSKGIYPTHITKDDLPNDFVYGRYYKRWGYLSIKDIKDIYYRRSLLSDTNSIKYDTLYISYSESLNTVAILNNDYHNENYDEYVYGNSIIDILQGIIKYPQYNDDNICKKAQEIQQSIKNIMKGL